ncbi:MAG TPA: cupredoxin domain-containing protein [Nitrososphaeraceae archaeon]|nr:cupredoxin domain-containing protein [Nitrososphaeraceae archaeon]
MGHATVEWIYIGAVIAILCWVGASAWNVEHQLEAAPPDAETIKVTGQQWFWTFEHEDGTKEVGELHVKQNVPYKFEITSQDVIHDFNVPDFVILMDAVPGRINTLWNVFDVPGEYLIQCREYCGLLHYNMRGKLFVEPASAESTSAAAPATAAAPAAAPPVPAAAPSAASGNQTNQTSSMAGPSVTLTIPEGASVQGNPSYDPDPLTVSAGDTVEVMNEDTAPHTVTSGTDSKDPESGSQFDTSIIDAGATAQVDTANLAAGEYDYYCTVHPYMVDKLEVS